MHACVHACHNRAGLDKTHWCYKYVPHHVNLLQDIKSHLLSMKLNPVKIKKPDSAPKMCYVNFGCEEDRQVFMCNKSLLTVSCTKLSR